MAGITAEQLARLTAKVYEPDLDWDNPGHYDLLDRQVLTESAETILSALQDEGYTVQKSA